MRLTMSNIPEHFKNFKDKFPEIYQAYEQLGKTVHNSGPLDEKTRSLIKLGIAAGARLEGAVHSHTRKALECGCTKDEIIQVVLLTIPTIGFPSAMAVLSWVEDIIEQE
jgi:alkylhydroperoxidase/carboxymuconolactone decarboxylase family protein YurZ